MVEEAARSGLFDAEQTRAMLVLVKETGARNLYLGEATARQPHMERSQVDAVTRHAPLGGMLGSLLPGAI